MKYPNYKIYEEIYKRYFQKGVKYLTDLADLKPEDNVLDLCGGNGRITREALKICKNVSYLDQEKDMIPQDLARSGVKVFKQSVQEFIKQNSGKIEEYDKVFCQQAVNYWLLHTDIEQFSKMIKKDGLFLFNTFAKQPSKVPSIKQYQIAEKNYIEISYLIENQVIHIQIEEGFEPHITKFDWISPETYKELLSPYFEVTRKTDGKSDIYICRRKQ